MIKLAWASPTAQRAMFSKIQSSIGQNSANAYKTIAQTSAHKMNGIIHNIQPLREMSVGLRKDNFLRQVTGGLPKTLKDVK